MFDVLKWRIQNNIPPEDYSSTNLCPPNLVVRLSSFKIWGLNDKVVR